MGKWFLSELRKLIPLLEHFAAGLVERVVSSAKGDVPLPTILLINLPIEIKAVVQGADFELRSVVRICALLFECILR